MEARRPAPATARPAVTWKSLQAALRHTLALTLTYTPLLSNKSLRLARARCGGVGAASAAALAAGRCALAREAACRMPWLPCFRVAGL